MSHTPGPWHFDAVFSLLLFGRKNIGPWDDESIWPADDSMNMPDEDDAHLITAAPDLLEALECYAEKVADLSRYGVIIETSLREKAEAAIAKAKGVLAEGDSGASQSYP